MSEPIPEAIPTSADPKSRRPVKRIRVGNGNKASATQADEIEALMWDPSRPVQLPPSAEDLKAKSALAPPPEIVANVQGSSAGAGSGEFHVYKASRRREYERLKAMDEEAQKEENDEKWEEQEKSQREKDEEKTRKNREKRNRRKKGGTTGGGAPSGQSKRDQAGGEDNNPNGVEKKGIDLPRTKREASTDANDFVVAEVVKENGITIHDDD